jgi:hypothetical protein
MLTRAPGNLPADVEDVMFRVIGAAIEVHRHLGRAGLLINFNAVVLKAGIRRIVL